jgi:hypothetical protein
MKALQYITALSLLGSAAFAGTAASGKAGPAVTPPVESPFFTGSATLGYDSEYYFRGLWFSSNNVWGSLNLSHQINDKLSLGLGALYTSAADTDISGAGSLDYSELDLIASLNYDAGFAKLGLVYTNYSFFDTFSGSIGGKTFGFDNAPDSTVTGASDLGLTAAIPLGSTGANLYLGGYYDFKIEEFYFEVGADYTIAVTDSLSLVPAVQVGYAGSEYYTYAAVSGVDSGWTHVRVGLSAPWKLTSTVTLTPYIAVNCALDAREQLNTVRGKNDVYGGVSLSVSF